MLAKFYVAAFLTSFDMDSSSDIMEELCNFNHVADILHDVASGAAGESYHGEFHFTTV